MLLIAGVMTGCAKHGIEEISDTEEKEEDSKKKEELFVND